MNAASDSFLIGEGHLESLRDFEHGGRTVLAGRLGYRITPRFVRTFFIQTGFLDGRHGLLVCALQSYGTFLKWSYLWERRRLNG